MPPDFTDRTVLVTGGSSGIGLACARAFAAQGARVVVAARGADAGKAATEEIRQAGGEATFIPCDITRADEVAALVNGALDAYGGLDVAVNNAGIAEFTGPTADCSEDDFDRVVATNLKGVWLSMKHEIPPMVAQGRGAIVNVAGAFGLIGFANMPGYVAAKHGVVGLTRAAALEYATSGLRINAICPGLTQTPLVERATGGDPAVEAQLAALMPINRVARPEEVADAVLWMASDESTFLLGHALALDGGWVAG